MTENHGVGGSIPPLGTTPFRDISGLVGHPALAISNRRTGVMEP